MSDEKLEQTRSEVARLNRVERFRLVALVGLVSLVPAFTGVTCRLSYFQRCGYRADLVDVVKWSFAGEPRVTLIVAAATVVTAVGLVGVVRAGALSGARRLISARLSSWRAGGGRAARQSSPYRVPPLGGAGSQGKPDPVLDIVLSKRGCLGTGAAMPLILAAGFFQFMSWRASLSGGGDALALTLVVAASLLLCTTAAFLAFGRTVLRLDGASRIGRRSWGVGWLGPRKWFVLSEHARVHVHRVSDRPDSDHAVELLLSDGDFEVQRYERHEKDQAEAVAARIREFLAAYPYRDQR